MHRLRQKLGRHALGAFGRGAKVFGHGDVRLALLSLLAEGQAHGYELMTKLEQRCGAGYKASAGTIYPTLQQLDDEGLVRVEAENGKKTYAITEDGRAVVRERADQIEEIWRRASSSRDWDVLHDPDAAEIIGPALRLAKTALKAVVKSHGDPVVIDEIREILEEARSRVDRLHRRGRR